MKKKEDWINPDMLSVPELNMMDIFAKNLVPPPLPSSDRMKKLEEMGFIGCLDDSEVNSTNYKEFLYADRMLWISVKDRFPERKNRYFIITDGKEVQTAEYVHWMGEENLDNSWRWILPVGWKKVTHWMPVPEIPPELSEP